MIAEMQALLGLDDKLDELILLGARGAVEAWRRPLQRLQKNLSQGGAAAGRLDLLSE